MELDIMAVELTKKNAVIDRPWKCIGVSAEEAGKWACGREIPLESTGVYKCGDPLCEQTRFIDNNVEICCGNGNAYCDFSCHINGCSDDDANA